MGNAPAAAFSRTDSIVSMAVRKVSDLCSMPERKVQQTLKDTAFAYCKDNATGVIYLHGNNDLFANMDVDCDGLQSEGDCSSDGDTQSETRWKDQVQEYSGLTDAPVDDLDANKIPYVVFGNECEGDCPEGFNTFDPRKYGVQPLSVMAVLCNNQLVRTDYLLCMWFKVDSAQLYGVWGDTNGDDDPDPMVGEASISLARACFPDEDISPDSGHDHDDVLYIAFPGNANATVFKHASWSAPGFDEFEDSISWLGDQLVKKLV